MKQPQKENMSNDNTSSLQRKWTMLTVRLGQRKKQEQQQRVENMKTAIGMMMENNRGSNGGESKIDKDSWSFFRASDPSISIENIVVAKMRPSLNRAAEERKRSAGERGLKQRDSNSSSNSQKVLIDGARW